MSCWPGPWWGVGHISLHWTSYSCVVFCLVTFNPRPPPLARHLPIRLARHFYERKDFNKINTSFGRWCGAKRAQKVLARSSFFLLSAMGDQLFLSLLHFAPIIPFLKLLLCAQATRAKSKIVLAPLNICACCTNWTHHKTKLRFLLDALSLATAVCILLIAFRYADVGNFINDSLARAAHPPETFHFSFPLLTLLFVTRRFQNGWKMTQTVTHTQNAPYNAEFLVLGAIKDQRQIKFPPSDDKAKNYVPGLSQIFKT